MVHNLMAAARAFGGGDFLLAKFAMRGKPDTRIHPEGPVYDPQYSTDGERYLTGPSYFASKSPPRVRTDDRPPASLSGWKLRLCDEI